MSLYNAKTAPLLSFAGISLKFRSAAISYVQAICRTYANCICCVTYVARTAHFAYSKPCFLCFGPVVHNVNAFFGFNIQESNCSDLRTPEHTNNDRPINQDGEE